MSSLSKIQHQPSPIQEFIIPIIEHRWFKYPFREFGMFILDGYNEMVLPILPKKDMPASRMPKYMKFGKSLMENPREFKYNALPPFQLQTRFGIVNVYPYLKIIEKPISSPNYLSTKDIHFVSLDEIYAKKYCSMNIHNSVLDMFNQQSPLYKLAFIQKSKSSYFPIPKIGFHGTDQYGDKEKDPKNDIVKKIIETGFKQSRKDSENPPMFGEGIYLGNFWKAARYSFFKNDINYTFRNHPVLIRTVFDMGPRPYFIPPNWTSEKYQYSLSYNYLSLDRERKLNGNPPLGSDKIYQNYEEADNDFHDPEGNLLKQGYSSVIVHPFSLKIRDRRARNNYKLKSFVSHPEYIIPSNDNIGILSMYHLDPNSTAKHTKYTFKNGRNQIRISESPEVHEDEQMINKPGDPRYWKMITIQDDLQNNVPLFSVRGRKLINSNFIKKQLSDEKIKEFKEEIQTNSTSLKDIEYLLHNKNYKEFLEKMMVNENNNYLPHDLIFQILPNEKLTNNQSIIKNLAIKERWYEVSKLLDSLKPNLIRKKSLKVYRESLEDIYSNFKHSIQKLSSYPSYLLSMEDKTSERAIQFEGLRDTIRHYLLSHDYSFESNKNLPIISSKMQEEILNLLPKELDNELIYSPSQFFLTKTILSSSNVNEKILDQLPVESFVFKTNNDFIHAWNFIIDSSNLRYLARKYPAFLWSPNIKIKKNKFNVNIPFVVYYAWNNPNNELSFELIELAFDSLGSASTGNAVLDTYNKQLSSNIAHFIIDRKPFDEPTEKQLNIIEKLSILTENPKDFIKKISDEWRFDFPIASEILKQLHHSIPIKPETEAEAEAKAKTEQQED